MKRRSVTRHPGFEGLDSRLLPSSISLRITGLVAEVRRTRSDVAGHPHHNGHPHRPADPGAVEGTGNLGHGRDGGPRESDRGHVTYPGGPPATSSVAAVSGPFFDVTAFGAVGDGVTDNYAALR